MRKALFLFACACVCANTVVAQQVDVDRRDLAPTATALIDASASQPSLFFLNNTPVSLRSVSENSSIELYIDSELLTQQLSASLSTKAGAQPRSITLPSLLSDANPETFLQKKRSFSLPLPKGGVVNVAFSRIKYYGETRYTLFAEGIEDATTQLVLSRSGNYFSGSLFTNGQVFRLVTHGEDTLLLKPENALREMPHHLVQAATARRLNLEVKRQSPFEFRPKSTSTPYLGTPRLRAMDLATNRNRPSILDIVIFYTAPARDQAGGEQAIQARAQSNVDTMNLVFQNSGVRAEARLVGVQYIDFVESAKFEDNLDRFADSLSVNGYRDQYGADLAQLFLSDVEEKDICGLGYRPSKRGFQEPINRLSTSGFQTTNISCGDYTSVHEFGHNLGMTHDKANSNNPTSDLIYPYAYGYFVDGVFRTMMSYSSECKQACPRIPYFSNPYLRFKGYPIGEFGQAHNALVADSTVTIVSQYRQSRQTQRLSNLTGLWFDPALSGSGFNFITKAGETLVAYYGFTQNGERLWLVSDKNLKPKTGINETIPLYETTQGTLNQPKSQIVQWGTLSIVFASCTQASAVLSGKDGTLRYQNLVQLSPSKDIACK